MKKHSLIVPASVNFGMTIYSNLAGVKGLEPSAFRVTGGRSNQLSYTPKNTKIIRTTFITKKVITAFILRFCVSGAPRPTRTDHLLLRNQLLYQMS